MKGCQCSKQGNRISKTSNGWLVEFISTLIISLIICPHISLISHGIIETTVMLPTEKHRQSPFWRYIVGMAGFNRGFN